MSELDPWRARASRLAGRITRAPASRWLVPWFRGRYRIRAEEAQAPAGGFQSLQQFFCRALRPELRPVAAAPDLLVSPADGLLTAAGVLAADTLLTAKGHAYHLPDLLGDALRAAQFHCGAYAIIYLAPADYHRVHAPAAGSVREARYLPGTRWPVNPRAVARVPGLLAKNERLVTYLETAQGWLALVMVGACLVGGLRVNYDPGWNAGPGPHTADRRRYDPAPALARGQELGRFEFGSTVILIAAPELAAAPALAAGTRVCWGAPLMRLRAASRPGIGPPAAC